MISVSPPNLLGAFLRPAPQAPSKLDGETERGSSGISPTQLV
jgi:hypothetical protein